EADRWSGGWDVVTRASCLTTRPVRCEREPSETAATGLGRLRSGRYPMVVSVVLTPTTRSQRHRLVLMGSLFLLAALPVGVVLVLLVNWPVAIGYVVVQTAGLLFGVRQQHTAALKLDDRGVQ